MTWFIICIILGIVALCSSIYWKISKGRVDRLDAKIENDKATTARTSYGQLELDQDELQEFRTHRSIGFGLVVGALVLCVITGLLSVIRVVPANNVGIPVTLGSIGDPMTSGIHFVLPWTKINNLSTRVQELSMLRAPDEGDKEKDDSIEVIAKDGGSMNVDLTVRYYVQAEKAATLFRQAGSMDLIKQRFVRPDAREVTRNIFGQYTAQDGYSTKRAEISQKIFDDLAPRLAARGIILDSVNVRDVAPEARVLESINNILQARNQAAQALEDQKKKVTEAETQRQVAEKEKEQAIIVAEGKAEATRIAAEAEAEANAKIAASLSPELAELKIAEACADAIARTNASVVNTCSGSASSGTTPGTAEASASTSVIVDGRNSGS